MPLITLTTDFGLADAYVGTMKGVIAGICPRARVIDITHGVSPGDVHGAAFSLASAARFFPRDTIHIAIVDPGVGSTRAALAIRTHLATFIGPDNGILGPAMSQHRVIDCRRIKSRDFCLPQISATFHGRDVFAPVAAHLARGRSMAQVGPSHPNPVKLAWAKPARDSACLRGEVIHLDRFGNAITNLPASWLTTQRGSSQVTRISAGKRRSIPLGDCYASVPTGKPVGVLGSSGFLEISVNQGSAASQLHLTVGSKVVVRQ
jgi:S-adenosylmethionine hydrolase